MWILFPFPNNWHRWTTRHANRRPSYCGQLPAETQLHLPVLDDGVEEWGEKWRAVDVGLGSVQQEEEHALQVVVGGRGDYW